MEYFMPDYFIPPKSVAKTAEKGLEYRKRAGGKGGLTPEQAAKEGVGSGVQRAVNLKNRDKIPLKTIKRMKAFFDRHKKNKSIDPKHKNEPWEDEGYVSHLLWGGDPGYEWVKDILKKEEKNKKACISLYIRRLANNIKDKTAVKLRIKPPKRRDPKERLKARLYYRKNRSKIRMQRRRYMRTNKSTLKHRKMFMRYKPTWFKKPKPPTHKKPKQAPRKLKVPKIKSIFRSK